MVRAIASTLRYADSLNLTELDITFPIAHDFGQLSCDRKSASCNSVERMMRPLGHLGLHVRDWTGPVLPADAAHANETSALNMFKLVEAARALESLAITGTNHLDMDQITFQHSLQLSNLYLSRLSLSPDTFSFLIKDCSECIRDVQLYHVELKSGTWQHALVEIIKVHPPNLVEFYMDSCGYSLLGTCVGLRPGLLPPPDDPNPIESSNYSDVSALRVLQAQVAENRRSSGLPVGYEYTRVEGIVESFMEELGLDT